MNENLKRLVVVALSCCLVGVVSVSAADAKDNWAKHCAKCHGKEGKGDTTMGKKLKVKDYTDSKVQEKFKDAELIKITVEGKKEGSKTLMKPFKDVLSEQEIKDLIAYIRKMKK